MPSSINVLAAQHRIQSLARNQKLAGRGVAGGGGGGGGGNQSYRSRANEPIHVGNAPVTEQAESVRSLSTTATAITVPASVVSSTRLRQPTHADTHKHITTSRVKHTARTTRGTWMSVSIRCQGGRSQRETACDVARTHVHPNTGTHGQPAVTLRLPINVMAPWPCDTHVKAVSWPRVDGRDPVMPVE